MGKIKDFFRCVKRRRNISLKWSFFMYIPICIIAAYAGAFIIGFGTNYAQDWYRAKYSVPRQEDRFEVYFDENGTPHTARVINSAYNDDALYNIISNLQKRPTNLQPKCQRCKKQLDRCINQSPCKY